MTAYTKVILRCDRFDRTAPAGQQFCHEGEYGSSAAVEGRTLVEARRLAAERGWTKVRHPMAGRSWRRFDMDLCPAHPPEKLPDTGGGRKLTE